MYSPGWCENPRGVSFTFGDDVIEKFCDKHDIDLIVRAHQVVEDGYDFQNDRMLVTVFSAPNYCGEFDNAGAIMVVKEGLLCSFLVLRPMSHKGKHLPGDFKTSFVRGDGSDGGQTEDGDAEVEEER